MFRNTYDAFGNRVQKSNGKTYWYGANDQILMETDNSGNVTNEYVEFAGKRVAILPHGSTAQFYVEDFLGSTRVLTTSTGTVCYDADITPFGGERTITNTCTQNNYKFEGKERDSETGNDDFGARYYSNRYGRWLSADWSTVPTPVPYANLTNPQTLNLYAMVGDDPETFADLDGHSCSGDGAGANPQCAGAQTINAASEQIAGAEQQSNQKKSIFRRIWKRFGPDDASDYINKCAFQRDHGGCGPKRMDGEVVSTGSLSAAASRAVELADALGKTKDFVTIAVTETEEGVNVVSSSETVVRPAVRGMLKESEIAVKGAGHAEVTGVNAAKGMGLTPTGVAASRGICPSCVQYLKDVAVDLLSAIRQ